MKVPIFEEENWIPPDLDEKKHTTFGKHLSSEFLHRMYRCNERLAVSGIYPSMNQKWIVDNKTIKCVDQIHLA
jgi:hypothetical protein